MLPLVIFREIAHYLDIKTTNAMATSTQFLNNDRANIITGYRCQNCMIFAASSCIDQVHLCLGCEWAYTKKCILCSLLHFRFVNDICIDCNDIDPTFRYGRRRRRPSLYFDETLPQNLIDINILKHKFVESCNMISTPYLTICSYTDNKNNLTWKSEVQYNNISLHATNITLSMLHQLMIKLLNSYGWYISKKTIEDVKKDSEEDNETEGDENTDDEKDSEEDDETEGDENTDDDDNENEGDENTDEKDEPVIDDNENDSYIKRLMQELDTQRLLAKSIENNEKISTILSLVKMLYPSFHPR